MTHQKSSSGIRIGAGLVVPCNRTITRLFEPYLDFAAAAFGAFHPLGQVGQRIIVTEYAGEFGWRASHAMTAAVA